MGKKSVIHDDQYWFEKDRETCAVPEPKHEEQDKEYGIDESPVRKNLINLTGNWFVYFGADLPDCKIEGSRILTLNGHFDPDTLMDVLVENLYKDLPEKGKEILNKYKQPTKKLVIRAFNRI